MASSHFFCIALGLSVPHIASSAKPKMVGKPITPGKALGPVQSTERISTSSATFLGDCHPGKPFEFQVPGLSGRGVIGVKSENNSISASYANAINELLIGAPQPNFFALESQDTSDYWGWPFQFEGADDNGDIMLIECQDPTPIIVIVNDESGFVLEATIDDEGATGKTLTLSNGKISNKPLQGKGHVKGQSGNDGTIGFANASNNSIEVRHNKGNAASGVAIIQAEVTNSDGNTVIRSFVMHSKAHPVNEQKPLNVKCCAITDDGDVELSIPSLGKPGKSYLVSVRLALVLSNGDDQDIVDYSAMLESGQTMTVHGGWIRKAIQENGLEGQTAGWDIKVRDVVAADPNNGYKVVGVLGDKNQVNNNRIPLGQVGKKGILAKAPAPREASISDEMRKGKKPETNNEAAVQVQRQLQSSRKILVHGYCSAGSPFPTSHFANEIVFADPDTTNPEPSNWSHDQFALKIDRFADNNNINSCGCIAHSQGGAACLHLHTYYWSCLDNGSGNRMIQSVGTPYQGTALAGNLGAIGDVFGKGCGYNYDLTYSGASAWLSNVGSSARSAVHYFTTSFEKKWNSYDYCSLATDLFLGDPEDGVTEKAYGQLSGANNRGHKTGWCHTSGMRDPHQGEDSGRNSDMNNNAYQ